MTHSADDRPSSVAPTHSGAEEADDLVGATLQNTYRLERVIGEGGMGRVYVAQHTRIRGKRFAVKVIRAEMAMSSEVRARFQREADAAASISHPNVVGAIDFGYADDGRPYLVSELLSGQDLGDALLDHGRLPVPLAVHIARKVAQGLSAAHAEGVIHRDLKPDNVHLLDQSARPEVKVLDFGLSRFLEARESASVSRTGIAMGTPSFMAPEQARGEKVDQRVDIYGVGAILYNTLTGQPPFDGDAVHTVMLKVMNDEPPRPRSINPEIPEELELVIQRAMAGNPAERFQTMEELDAALAHFDAPRGELPSVHRPPRRQLLSREGSLGEDADIGAVRPQVLFLIALAIAASLLALVTSVYGLPALLGRAAFSTSEFWLVLAAVLGTLLTPAVLVARWFWRRFWNNSVKMLELVPRLRGPVVGAIASYGLAVLLVFSLDAVRAQGRSGAAEAGGLVVLLPVLALIGVLAAITLVLRRRLLDGGGSGVRRALGGPVLTGAAVLACVALLQVGMGVRDKRATAATATASAEPLAAPSVPASDHGIEAPAPSVTAAPAGGDVAVAAAHGKAARATPDELRAAEAGGVEALVPLAKRYPEDPALREKLALALGATTEGLPQAMSELDALYRLDPQKANDKSLHALVVKGALSPGEASTRALDLMSTRMGTLGLDMLYDLMITSVPLRQAARERLDDPDARKRFSPALAVAFELRTAKSCEERVPMLARAEKEGDARAVSALIALSTGAKRGCGPKKNKPCPPSCPAEAARLRASALALQASLNAKKR